MDLFRLRHRLFLIRFVDYTKYNFWNFGLTISPGVWHGMLSLGKHAIEVELWPDVARRI